jgi:hypothetical protein
MSMNLTPIRLTTSTYTCQRAQTGQSVAFGASYRTTVQAILKGEDCFARLLKNERRQATKLEKRQETTRRYRETISHVLRFIRTTNLSLRHASGKRRQILLSQRQKAESAYSEHCVDGTLGRLTSMLTS